MDPDDELICCAGSTSSTASIFVSVHLLLQMFSRLNCAVSPPPRPSLLLVARLNTFSRWSCPYLQVRTFDEHEESVYSLAWSASDAWVLASLSYDGLVVLNHVPSTEKYKILL